MKKISKLLLMLIVVMLVLAGCAKSEEPAGEEKDVTVWVMPYAGDKAKLDDLWKDVAKQFNEKTGGTAHIEIIPWANRGTKILTALASGQGPDVFYVIPDEIPKYISDGLIADLDAYLGDNSMDDFVASALAPSKVDGKQYGLPILQEAYSLIYNKDIIEAIGEDPNNLPKNWAEFEEWSLKAKALGFYGTIYQAAASLNGTLYTYIWQAGGDILTSDGSVHIDSDKSVKAFEFINRLYKEGLIPADFMNTQNLRSLFVEGKVLAIQGSAAEITDSKDSFDAVLSAPLKEEAQVTYGSAGSFVMSKISKAPKAAAEFIKLLTNSDNQKTFNEITGYIPSRVSARSILEANPIAKQFAEYTDYVKTGVNHPLSRDVMPAIQAAVQEMLEGTTTPQEAAKKAAEAIKTALKK